MVTTAPELSVIVVTSVTVSSSIVTRAMLSPESLRRTLSLTVEDDTVVARMSLASGRWGVGGRGVGLGGGEVGGPGVDIPPPRAAAANASRKMAFSSSIRSCARAFAASLVFDPCRRFLFFLPPPLPSSLFLFLFLLFSLFLRAFSFLAFFFSFLPFAFAFSDLPSLLFLFLLLFLVFFFFFLPRSRPCSHRLIVLAPRSTIL
mmetsp:Transcript_5000/g.10927  ORF Transcript_5000/g.10927 Transcript_5000/m.10927 type:complete len:203 (-) Transcript_5000:45-653(-)